LLAGGQAEPDEQVGLAGAAVAEQHDRLAVVQVGAGGQAGEEGGGDGRDGVGAEVGQSLDAREAGFGDAAGAAPGGTVVELGGEDLGEVGQIGGVFPGGDLGQPGGLVADGGQLEVAAAAPMAAWAAVSEMAVTGWSWSAAGHRRPGPGPGGRSGPARRSG
jgi:hypothetical protein